MNYAYTSLPTRKWGKRVVTNWKTISVGDTINYDLASVTVLSNEIVQGVTKTGKVKRPRRIVVKLGDSNIKKEIGTESFKKGSFLKRMLKDLKQIGAKIITKNNSEHLDFILKRYEMPLLLEYTPIQAEYKPVNELSSLSDKDLRKYFYDLFDVPAQKHNIYDLGTSEEQIQKCYKEMNKLYKKLARKYHPDMTGGNDRIMGIVNYCYESLVE